MSEYQLQSSPLPFSSYNEAKEKRRKVLEEVQARRRIIYQRYLQKKHTSSLPTTF
ncbi:MAG: hypothetical protein NVSMB38_45690 [Ktedonobacteraceae bacterium]